MNLYILRHGIAVEAGTEGYSRDSDRPLTTKGQRKVALIAQAMEVLGISNDIILSSPYVRARETAEIVADRLGLHKRLELNEALIPSGNPERLIAYLNALGAPPEDVLLVGHEPYLSGLIALLVSGSTRSTVIMKKGGLCKLSAVRLKPGRCASLEWLLTPKQMCLMV